jgi:hypothetical protein
VTATLAAPLDLKVWFGENVRALVQVNPVSTSSQPVHALGSFVAKVTEIEGPPRRLADIANLTARKEGLWAVSDTHVRALSKLVLPDSDSDLDQLRHALAGLLAADRAVYKSAFSFQLAHVGLANTDRTDGGLSDLSVGLILSAADGPERLVRMVDRLFERQRNPHWAISSLLVSTEREHVTIADPRPAPGWTTAPGCGTFADDCRTLLLRAVDLVSGGHDTLLGLRILATTITWLGLIVYAQVPRLTTADALNLMVIEAGEPGQLPGLRDASAASRRALNGVWDEWLAILLTKTVEDRFGGKAPQDAAMRRFLRDCTPYAISGGSQFIDQIDGVYKTWRSNHDAFDAAGQTLRDFLSASMGNKPQRWFDAVGRHSGFVGPRRGHPARFRAEVSLLPTLVLAGLDDDDPPAIPMSLWLDRLVRRYGLVFGPDAKARTMPDRAPEEDLVKNRDLLSSLMSAVGLARRYNDGVTEVLNIGQLWRRQQ